MSRERQLLEWLLRSVYEEDGSYYPCMDFDGLIETVKLFLKETE